jgi:hypothetical protein
MRATGGTLQLRRSNSSRRICQICPITDPSPSAAKIWIIVTATRLIGLSPLANHPDAQWLINRFGSDQLRSRLVGQDGRPMIYCFSTHSDSIRTIPALQHDPARPEDVNTESEDHAADEWRYACMSRPFVRVPAAASTRGLNSGYAAYRSAAPGDWKLY